MLAFAACLVNTRAQTFGLLHTFTAPISSAGTNADGANPSVGLTLVDGVLCGSTFGGGLYGAGTLFYLGTDGNGFYAFHPMTNTPDAGFPAADLLVSGNTFFGTTTGGGKYGNGTVFVGQTNDIGSLVHSFAAFGPNGSTNRDGAKPSAPVVLAGNTLYGTATAGGLYGNGVVFSVVTNGLTGSVLHHFTAMDATTGTNADGANPYAGLVSAGSVFYGAASGGGTGGSGTLFSVNPDGSGFTVLYSFTPVDPATGTNTDGANPYGSLVLSGGTLYGTTANGGNGANGTVFSISTNRTGVNVTHHFTPLDVGGANTDGAGPLWGMVLSSDGTLYGTTPQGGTGGSGTVYSINTNGAVLATLYTFTPLNNLTNADGANPNDLLLAGDNLYGTAKAGGGAGVGTVFKLNLAPSSVLPIPLNIKKYANQVVLTWSDPVFSLQFAPLVAGPYTNAPGATSPYTKGITRAPLFFRLIQ